jgi:RNA polymerase sigma factor (sigma-70 family)
MPDDERPDSLSATATPQGRQFPATHWELVARVREGGEPRRAALDEICTLYWYPIYAFLRRQGHAREDAEDLTQGFFVKVLADETLEAADPTKGRLRTFLLQVLKRHVTDRIRHDTAQKRGGPARPLSLEALAAEERYAAEPADNEDPEAIFMRAWAEEMLAGVRVKLQEALAASGRAEHWDTLLPFLLWDAEPPSYRDIAGKLGSSETAARLLVFRLRTKFRDLLRTEVSRTVSSTGQADEEIAWLQSVLVKR